MKPRRRSVTSLSSDLSKVADTGSDIKTSNMITDDHKLYRQNRGVAFNSSNGDAPLAARDTSFRYTPPTPLVRLPGFLTKGCHSSRPLPGWTPCMVDTT